jgi:hypothetical protein
MNVVKPDGTTSSFIFLEVRCHPRSCWQRALRGADCSIFQCYQVAHPSWYKGYSWEMPRVRRAGSSRTYEASSTTKKGQVPGAGVRTIGCDGLRINQVDDVMSINSLHL